MDSLGQYLKECRTKRGMSLEDVAARTRVRLQTLQALEHDDYLALPVEVTVKGFLRAYARCLGLDEQEVLARYQQFAAEHVQTAHNETLIGEVEQRMVPVPFWRRNPTLVGMTISGLAIVISGLVLFAPRVEPEHPASIAVPGRVAPPDPPPAGRAEDLPGPRQTPTPIAPDQPAPTFPTDGIPSGELRAVPITAARLQQLTIAATETSWVQVIIDDRETQEALLQPGQRVDWQAQATFKLTIGNAGGVTVAFNGEPLPALGPSGKVRTLVLPRVAMNSGARAARVPARSTPTAPLPSLGQSTPPATPSGLALTSPPNSTTVPSQPLQ